MDVEDVGRRVMEQLLGVRATCDPTLERGSIVVADNLLPGHFARLEIDKVAAIVSEHGGPTSHGAIFARTLEIPAVTGVAGMLAAMPARRARDRRRRRGHGLPLARRAAASPSTERAQQRYEVAAEHLDALRALPGRDARRPPHRAHRELSACVSDLRLVEQHGAEGIGLFRTELLALAHRGFPEEEEQEQLYERVADAARAAAA